MRGKYTHTLTSAHQRSAQTRPAPHRRLRCCRPRRAGCGAGRRRPLSDVAACTVCRRHAESSAAADMTWGACVASHSALLARRHDTAADACVGWDEHRAHAAAARRRAGRGAAARRRLIRRAPVSQRARRRGPFHPPAPARTPSPAPAPATGSHPHAAHTLPLRPVAAELNLLFPARALTLALALSRDSACAARRSLALFAKPCAA